MLTDIKVFLEEQPWTPTELPGGGISYSRPLYGSERVWQQTHNVMDGLSETVAGVTLHTTVARESLRERFIEGLSYCRFVAPILSSSIEVGIHEPDVLSWVYTPALSSEEAKTWAQETLEVIEEPHSVDSFIALCNGRRLPYTLANGNQQYFRAFLLLDLGGECAFALHGTHAVFDAHTCLNLFCVLLTYIAGATQREVKNELSWGTEWKNLPPGPITATGGPQRDWETKGMELLKEIQERVTIAKTTLTMSPARDVPRRLGTNLRVIEVIDADMVNKLAKKSKEMGYSVGTLFEAAHALAIYRAHQEVALEDNVCVASEGSYINLSKFKVPPYNARSQLVGALAMVPVIHPSSIVKENNGTRAQLAAAMENVKNTYSAYLANPHLPAITAVSARITPGKTASTRASVTNIGVIDRTIPLQYFRDGSEGSDPAFEIDDVWFGQRTGACSKLTVHFWTLKGRMYLMTQTNDTWDEEYLRNFLLRIIAIACDII